MVEDLRWFEYWNRKGTVLQWDIKSVITTSNSMKLECLASYKKIAILFLVK